ncbi:MAG TPA: alanine--tRNA ligase [Candidatus Omnitrophota bacterium]|nr:alanine--tRNA ligase [Candidatus Omnitrophota bacterium]
MKTDIVRRKYLDFFKSKKHRVVESDSLVPKDDPTVLFTPAGMNQFKPQFLGHITDYTRATTSQRCLRTDDLDKVGKTTGHHTFFEMLGNFSFGDYFKKEAIQWAWEFLIGELKIPESRLWVSVYKDDDEAYAIWRDVIKIPEKRIVRLGDHDNFWPADAKEKGPNGPCGPCSEIFYDFGEDVGCREKVCDPSCSCGRFVEIWNLVFTQFNRKDNGVLEPLPQKNIDTGMGLERLAAVMQKAPNNFETDLFQPLIQEVKKAAKKHPANEKECLYAIADHARATIFSIFDGVLPSNEGRGYVVRKLIRKTILHLRSMGIEKPFMNTLVPVLAQVMQDPYPELETRRENIAGIILTEEKNFIMTINSSGALLAEKFSFASATAENASKVGVVAFQVYDTYGIPLELTLNWLKAKKIPFSQEAFDKAMNEQKDRSKAQSSMKGDVFASSESKLKIADTKFLGYAKTETPATILAILKGKELIKKAAKGEDVSIILDKTAFYAESGGQVGDTGTIVKGKNIFEVTDTQKIGKIFLHHGKVKEGSFTKLNAVTARIDNERRLDIARNHTATHLLQAALRKILGAHVQQQGSLVDDVKLRFDFTHFKALTQEEMNRVEEIVNTFIISNHELDSKEMTLAVAKKSGALAFFAEKYEGKVRVVAISDFSKEFCGGTHLQSTGQIGYFKIIHEGSVASGVRRIEAVTGRNAFKVIKEEESVLSSLEDLLKVPSDKIVGEFEKRLSRIKDLEKQASAKKNDAVKTSLDDMLSQAQEVKGIKIIAKVIPDADAAVLRNAIDMIKQKSERTLIALGSGVGGRALLVMGVTADLVAAGIDAGKLVQDIAKCIGGSGGGRKDFAQAGGANPGEFESAFTRLKVLVENMP